MFVMGCCLQIRAADFLNMDELKLTVPTMEPRLTAEQISYYRTGRPAQLLRTGRIVHTNLGVPPDDHAPWAKENWTWMRTNPDVKPYKVMDDLTFVGVPIFVAGIIAKSEKAAFRQNDGTKHVLLTNFKTSIDDYAQFFGPAMTTGLKIGGIEGRSDWGRYLASTAMSYAIMAAFVNGIKYTAKEMRPDGSTANSWPSGHTATAFVGATILHKEYGLTRSPWWSVAGYGVATATGVMRVLNNRHWISDVLSGAGIGIMSGELAYALSDVFFKERGLLRGDISGERSIIEHPSFFSVSMGMGLGSKDLDFGGETVGSNDDFHLEFRTSTAVAAEGAYFFNKYIGVGGRLRVNSSPINGWDRVLDFADRDVKDNFATIAGDADLSSLDNIIYNGEDTKPQFSIESDHLTEFAADLGVYFNMPLSDRFALGAKLLAGRSIMQELNLSARYQGEVKDFGFNDDSDLTFVSTGETYDTTWDYFTLSANNTMKFGTGISLTYAYKDNFAWKVFVDYDYARKTYTLEYNPSQFMYSAMPSVLSLIQEAAPGDYAEISESLQPVTSSIKKGRNTFIFGGSFVISF